MRDNYNGDNFVKIVIIFMVIVSIISFGILIIVTNIVYRNFSSSKITNSIVAFYENKKTLPSLEEMLTDNNEEIKEEKNPIDKDILAKTVGLNKEENDRAVDILFSCGIEAIESIEEIEEVNKNRCFNIKTIAPTLYGIHLYFSGDNNLVKIDYVNTIIYENETVFYSIWDMVIPEETKSKYEQIIIEEMQKEFPNTNISFSNIYDGPQFILNEYTHNRVIGIGVLIIVKEDETVLVKTVDTVFIEGEIIDYNLENFDGFSDEGVITLVL